MPVINGEVVCKASHSRGFGFPVEDVTNGRWLEYTKNLLPYKYRSKTLSPLTTASASRSIVGYLTSEDLNLRLSYAIA